jgi:hypothetical protein
MSGRKVLLAVLAGLVLGWMVGVFLESIVANTPNDIDPDELHRLRWLLAAAGALSGLAIESIRQLQAASTDPAYRRRSRFRP